MSQKLALTLSMIINLIFAIPATAEGLALDGSLTLVSQTVRKTGALNDSQLTNRVDVTAEMPAGKTASTEGKLFAHIRAGNKAPAGNDAFATSNSVNFDFPGAVLLQAWYQLDISAGAEANKVELTAGKIDPFYFFDGNALSDDETEGFLNLAFVHNPLLDVGGDVQPGVHGASPGMRLAYVSTLKDGSLTVSAGVFGTAGNGEQFDNIFNNAFSIAQVEYAGKAVAGQEGSYRLYGWNNRNQQHRGWGASIDQAVNSHVSVFARYGDRTQGNGNFNNAWTLGAQINGGYWGREDDRLGLAYGVLNATAGGSEKITELFYAIKLFDSLQITPSIQQISDASATRGADRTVYSLRAKAAF